MQEKSDRGKRVVGKWGKKNADNCSYANQQDCHLLVNVVNRARLIRLEFHQVPEKLFPVLVVLEDRQHDLPHVGLEGHQLEDLKVNSIRSDANDLNSKFQLLFLFIQS